tara:strand:- start:29304 stop:30302 length:999 start_codon:yes stop_codon:yes gene_type:complete
MSIVHSNLIEGPTSWKGSEISNDPSWTKVLATNEIEELRNAVSEVKSSGLSFPNFTKDKFPLPTLSKKLSEIGYELECGLGFLLLKGVPVEEYDKDDDIKILYYGMGLHMGQPVRQNPKGELIGTVINVGDQANPQTRVYETNAYLPYHSDPTDVVGLLCIHPAKTGGVSSLISATTLHNEMLNRHPEYLSVLYRPMWYPHVGNEPSQAPIFSYHENKLSCRYMRQYLELSHNELGIPLSPVELEAFDLMDSIMHENGIRIDMMMQRGDLQLVNNYTVLHSRTNFEDDHNPSLRRKKLRLWLNTVGSRELGYDFPGRYGFPSPEIPETTIIN